MTYLLFLGLLISSFSSNAETIIVQDSVRGRSIPISIQFPESRDNCHLDNQCNVAFISAGNKVPYMKYQFITQELNKDGYMTVAVNHELPNDPPLSITGDLYQTRIENWQRGADTLNFLQHELSHRFPSYSFESLTLIGHSNGGDISAWLGEKSYVYQLITLDSKRVALPKSNKIRVLSIGASEYPTKAGIMPTNSEQKKYGSCVVKIPNSKHMDLTDYGSEEVKDKANKVISGFLRKEACDDLNKKIL